MPILDDPLAWTIRAAIALVALAAVTILILVVVPRLRRGRRAQARAATAVLAAGEHLDRLDAAATALDIEITVSGALLRDDAPRSIRRARMNAVHACGTAFAELGRVTGGGLAPTAMKRQARRIGTTAERETVAAESARNAHAAWVAAMDDTGRLVSAARERIADTCMRLGDSTALIAELPDLADEAEWERSAARGARTNEEMGEARRLIDRASDIGEARTRLAELASAERALRRAERGARLLEERHQLIVQSTLALADEQEKAASALRSARAICAAMDGARAVSCRAALTVAQDELNACAGSAHRRPVSTVARLAALHRSLDEATGDGRTPQQELLASRLALAGTLAAARSALADAELDVDHSVGIPARILIESARDRLASARQLADPNEAIALARAAIDDARAARDLATTG